MFTFNTSFSSTLASEVYLYQTVLKTASFIITQLSNLGRLRTRLVLWYRRARSQKDHALLVFFPNPFSSAKTVLGLLLPGPLSFSHLYPQAAHQQYPCSGRGPLTSKGLLETTETFPRGLGKQKTSKGKITLFPRPDDNLVLVAASSCPSPAPGQAAFQLSLCVLVKDLDQYVVLVPLNVLTSHCLRTQPRVRSCLMAALYLYQGCFTHGLSATLHLWVVGWTAPAFIVHPRQFLIQCGPKKPKGWQPCSM